MNRVRIKAGQTLTPRPVIELPASKSISNRLLILHVLSNGLVSISNISKAEDTVMLRDILMNHISGDRQSGTYYCGNAGTVLRFLTGYFACQQGTYTLECSEEMKRRPVHPLVDALRKAGAKIEYLEKEGFPPLIIKGRRVLSPVKTVIDGSMSSQFISALLLSGFQYGLDLEIKGERVSWPYVLMTLKILSGCRINHQFSDNSILIPPQTPGNVTINAEYDWSSAAPWYVYTALQQKGFSILIQGLKKNSIQGDCFLYKFFSKLGVNSNFRKGGVLIKKSKEIRDEVFKLDMHNYPDLVPAILVACAATGNSVSMTGVEHLSIKESDRIQAMKNELKKLGTTLDVISPNEIFLKPGESEPNNRITINTYNDHRIAMAFAPIAFKYPLSIENPNCVAKSYPSFWEEFEKAGFTLVNEPAK